jgi:hypothetical protein
MSAIEPPERDKRMTGNGGRFLAIGLAIIAIGLVITFAIDTGIGLAVVGLGCVPAAAGAALLASAAVSRRARSGRPFA